MKRRRISLNYDFLKNVEPTIEEIIHDIQDLNYKDKTFDLIGSNTCLMQINGLTLELKALVEDLISLEKRFKYSSNYAVLSEIEEAKKFCHQSFIHLYDICNIIENNPIENISNETLLSVLSRLDRDVKQVDSSLRNIGDILLETQYTHFESINLNEEIDVSTLDSDAKLNLMQICIMAYEGLMSMPFLDRQEMASHYLKNYKIAMENLMKCMVHEPLSLKRFEAVRYDLISSLESIRFCLNRETKMGRALDIKIKLITQNVRKAASQINTQPKANSLKK
ncbi:MAG: hypothetical protein U1E78_10030 [Gammaproteobacteria bacterium]